MPRMTDILDSSRPEHEKARALLENDLIAWFTTTDDDGTPHAVPVWFMWHEGTVVVFSEPGTVKVRHVERGSRVLVHLNAGGPWGDDVVVLTGSAAISPLDATTFRKENFADAYDAKYSAAIEAFGMPPEALSEKYSTVLVFTPERVLAW